MEERVWERSGEGRGMGRGEGEGREGQGEGEWHIASRGRLTPLQSAILLWRIRPSVRPSNAGTSTVSK